MATKPSIKITYSMLYRGTTQLWSNRYHFDGFTPATSSDWLALETAIKSDHRAIVPSTDHLVGFTGYAAGSDVPVYSSVVNLAGTAAYLSDATRCPGDTAALVRFSTTQRTSKNHPIYLFKYFHAAYYNNTVSPDTIAADMKGTLDTVMGNWVTGYSVSGNTVKYCGPNGAVAQSKTTELLLTHRDFHR